VPKKRRGTRGRAAPRSSAATYRAANGRTKRVGAGQTPVQVVVVDSTDRVPHLSAPAPRGDRRRKKSWVGQLPVDASRLAWRRRWQLTPAVADALVLVGGATAPWSTLGATSVLGGAAYGLARADGEVAGRKLLSRQERLLVTYWSAGAAGATIVELLTATWAAPRAVFVLAAATAYPTWRWVASRRTPRRRQKLSPEAAARLALWARVGRYSEGTLKGSTVVSGTAAEPTPGTLVFTAQLRADVHGKAAESEVVWQKVEALLGLPPDTVRIRCDRDNATRVQVTMAATRHLELNTVPWPGPELDASGAVLLGDTLSGVTVVAPRYDDKGVKHGRVSGNTGNGKTTTARVICTARASARTNVGPAEVPAVDPTTDARYEETIWLLDGKRGTSLPEVSNLFDWYAVTDGEWPLVLDAFYRVLLDRQLRRGKAKLSAWRSGQELDPILTLYVAESSAVRASLQARGLAKKYDRLVLECLQHGRALGIVVIQEAQDAVAENWLGGRRARELMSKGAAVLHRPGGATGQQFAGDGGTERMRLLRLPDAEGFAAVLVNGRPAADVMRVRWCSEEAAAAFAADYVPRALVGADAAAAGASYAHRTRGREDDVEGATDLPVAVGADDRGTDDSIITDDPTRARAPARVEAGSRPDDNDNDNDNADDADGPDAVDWVYKLLMFNPAGLTVEQIVERGGGQRGRSQPNVYRCLRTLKAQERVTQDGTRYAAVRRPR
jgi:hypothetical protein